MLLTFKKSSSSILQNYFVNHQCIIYTKNISKINLDMYFQLNKSCFYIYFFNVKLIMLLQMVSKTTFKNAIVYTLQKNYSITFSKVHYFSTNLKNKPNKNLL